MDAPRSKRYAARRADTLLRAITAKDKLRQAVEELTELEAERVLEIIARRREHDPVLELFNNAPEVDEPLTPEERASLDEAWAQRHDSVPLDEFMREFD